MEKKRRHQKTFSEKGSSDQAGGPDTTSFMSFLYSFLSCSEASVRRAEDGEKDECNIEMNEQYSTKGSVGSRKRQSAKSKCSSGKKHYQGRNSPQSSNQEDAHGAGNGDEGDWHFLTDHDIKSEKGSHKSIQQDMLLEMSEPSLLLSKHFSSYLCSELPTLAQGRKWVLLYSTWKHGISLHTLYRRSTLSPGPCLLVVGDRRGAVFGGLLTGPLRPTSSKKYEGTNDTFVFTNVSGTPVLFRPTASTYPRGDFARAGRKSRLSRTLGGCNFAKTKCLFSIFSSCTPLKDPSIRIPLLPKELKDQREH